MAETPGPTSAYLDLDAKVHWACDGAGGLDEPGDCGFEAPAEGGGG